MIRSVARARRSKVRETLDQIEPFIVSSDSHVNSNNIYSVGIRARVSDRQLLIRVKPFAGQVGCLDASHSHACRRRFT